MQSEKEEEEEEEEKKNDKGWVSDGQVISLGWHRKIIINKHTCHHYIEYIFIWEYYQLSNSVSFL